MDPSFLTPLASTLRFLFNVQPKDIPVCHTRIIHRGRNWPWNHRLGVHPLQDGRLEITHIP